jgi:hypothetical protein
MDAALTATIQRHIAGSRAAVPEDLQQEFCKIWPGIVTGLQTVESILKLIPVAAVAIPFIEGVITVGNLVKNSLCGN